MDQEPSFKRKKFAKMAKSKLCIDIDNVLCHSDKVMRAIIKKQSSGQIDLDYEDIITFNYYECTDKSGMSLQQRDWPNVHDSFSAREILLSLEPYHAASDHLQELVKLYELHIVTSRQPKARGATRDWLDKYHIPFDYLHFAEHRKKHELGLKFSAAIEDDFDQAILFSDSGVTCFLLSHPWNKSKPDHAGIVRVDNWAELSSKIKEDISAEI